MRAFALAAALMLAAATPGFAQSANGSTFTVRDATAAPQSNLVIDGASWRCANAVCTGTGGQPQPAPRACRRIVAKVGAVASFTYKGVTLNDEQLATCNTAAA